MKKEEIEYFERRFGGFGNDVSTGTKIAVGVILGVIFLGGLFIFYRDYLYSQKMRKIRQSKLRKKRLIRQQQKLAGTRKCNPKLPKATNPLYICNSKTGRWVKKIK